MRLFVLREGVVRSRLSEFEIAVLQLVPKLLTTVGEPGADPAADRLTPQVYPDDPDRSDEFRRLSNDLIDGVRRTDTEIFTEGLERVAAGEPLSFEEAASWMRALTHARLILGARLGIEEDGWERSGSAADDPRVGVLHFLGHLQDDLVSVLMSDL